MWCSACGPFTKNKERMQKFKETGDTRYIYQNKLDKASFQHYIGNSDFKNLPRRTVSDKELCDKAFVMAKIQSMMDNKIGLAWMVYKLFD